MIEMINDYFFNFLKLFQLKDYCKTDFIFFDFNWT